MDGAIVVELENIGGEIQVITPVKAQPLDILLDRADELDVLLAGIGIIEAQVAARAEAGVFLGEAKVETDCFRMSNMEVAIGLGWESGDGYVAVALGKITGNHIANEIALAARRRVCLIVHARDSTLMRCILQDFSSHDAVI